MKCLHQTAPTRVLAAVLEVHAMQHVDAVLELLVLMLSNLLWKYASEIIRRQHRIPEKLHCML